jgi:hypothetical protein
VTLGWDIQTIEADTGMIFFSRGRVCFFEYKITKPDKYVDETIEIDTLE